MPEPVYPELAGVEFQKLLGQCIHCGLCLEACPTYAVFGTEMDAPRGRIAQMRAAADGQVLSEEFKSAFTEHINLCLSCLACQTACPSGVQYEELVTTTRLAIEQNRHPGAVERFVRWLGFKQMMPHLGRLKTAAWLLRFYEVTGLQKLVRRWDFLPQPLKSMEAILPPVTIGRRDYSNPAQAIGTRRGVVAFFTGCIQEAFLAQVNDATVRILQRNGYEVHFPAGQTCCGAAQIHNGELELARVLAKKNLAAFESYDVVINNAGGCGATLKNEYEFIFKDDPENLERAHRFSERVKDISEFLAQSNYIRPSGWVPARVTYADSCHLRNAQKVIQQPRDLLQNIPGLELVEMGQPERCCGSAGVYNLVHPGIASEILASKMADIASTGAELIICSNTGCQMQLLAGVRQAGLNARVMHLAEVLDLSYQAENGQAESDNE